MTESCVALLGRPDEPTDAVEEYCIYLGSALQTHGFSLSIERVNWLQTSWTEALLDLEKKSHEWRDVWVLLQYTALSWSSRGFPLRVLTVLNKLKKSGARCGIVFHDAAPYSGTRIVDRLRRQTQIHTMQKLAQRADLSILTVHPQKINWLPSSAKNVLFMPVGANLPNPERAWNKQNRNPQTSPTVAIFSTTGGQSGIDEANCIASAVRFASERLGKIRLLMFGRNTEESGNYVKQALANSPVEVHAFGIVSDEKVVDLLAESDVMLFTRGPISTRRGSAIAGIACGLPLISQEGSETAPPITEAGVLFIPTGVYNDFGPALLRLLSDPSYRASLAERSRHAQTQHFSWAAISAKFATALRKNPPKP